MHTTTLVLAILALLSQPDAPVPNAAGLFPLQPLISEVAISLEILDPRERRYIMARPEDIESDLNLLRRRFRDLKDAPHVSDSYRLIEREQINEMLSFNRMYRQYIETAGAMAHSNKQEWYRDTLTETEVLYHIWDLARDARCEYYYVTVRRQALKKLRDQLGEANYHSGQMPPHVPIWRFTQQ